MSPEISYTAKFIKLGDVANVGNFPEAGNSFKYLQET
jgi:hypothetical protein